MEKELKFNMILYLLISWVSFSYLIMPQKAGVSVPIFIVIQLGCLFFIMPKKAPLFIFIPIIILSLNFFISGNPIWRVSNFLVIIVLYGVMALLSTDGFECGGSSFQSIFGVLRNVFRPFTFFGVPAKWAMESSDGDGHLLKRVGLGLVVSLLLLTLVVKSLASADVIFSMRVEGFLKGSFSFFSAGQMFKWLCGLAAGFYLFGLVYLTYQPPGDDVELGLNIQFSDFVIINMALFSVLSAYAIFTVIQFKYLFAGGGELPYGLSYTYYARRGFFELLFLSGFNIFAILLVVELTRDETGAGAELTKAFCCCLCLATFILLASSFYRMWLYSGDSGLTRLRFLVFGFLIFEAVGLLFTLAYIIKPMFNITLIYMAIGFTYYLLLNIIPMDSIIAKSQIDRYLATGKGDIQYAASLSSDAAPQIARLLASGDPYLQDVAEEYFSEQRADYKKIPGWQKRNLSAEKCLRIAYESRNL
ncbi:DUF4173 domain-containing protein [Deltaproteobacteria bacterium OttesenSCG-928-K17]|nr:DUF4173 domain-containing protein [Deltaproteobacteria bacterium OttesenSCG-928-K17]